MAGQALTLRVAYHLCAPTPGSELADLQNLTQLLPQGFGDAMLHFNGPGEILVWADWTDGDITPDGKAKLLELLRWAASKGYTIQLHWNPDRTVHDLLDVVEDISRDYPVRDLRWTVLHLYNASEDNLKRMKSLGLIWGVQDGPYFGGERLQREVGVEPARRLPPIATALRLGLTVAGGTDAHRVSSYNPFVALQWYLDGTTIGGIQTRDDTEAPSRRQALEMYTRNSAFMANDDDKRGTLEPGKFADLAVLSSDYPDGPGEGDRKDQVAADDGRRQGGLCRTAVCKSDIERGPLTRHCGRKRGCPEARWRRPDHFNRLAPLDDGQGWRSDQQHPSATGRKACSRCRSSLPPICSMIANACACVNGSR